MFNLSEDQLKDYGAHITTREIAQQMDLWQEAYDNYLQAADQVQDYLQQIYTRHETVQVIFSGAGTSAFVGETITPYLNKVNDNRKLFFRHIATTDIVASPEEYFQADVPTILVSFARSGNSPESVATVSLAQGFFQELYQVTITCAAEGQLAKQAIGDDRNLLLLQPERSNDQGFAMTGSYTCMVLTALLVFDPSDWDKKASYLETMASMGREVLDRVDEIQAWVDLDFNRVVYLGTGGFYGLAHEAQLKLLELTAGQVATQYESPLGFRHGPKSFVDEKTIVIEFISEDPYSQLYEVDMINEVYGDGIAAAQIAITGRHQEAILANQFAFDLAGSLPRPYLALPFVVIAQTFALLAAIKFGNKPDTPSPTGTVNRVVQGVQIYPYAKD